MFMLKAVEETSISTKNRIKKINSLLKETLEIVKRDSPKIYSKELVELLFEQPYSKNEYLVQSLGIERKTASRYLKRLEEVGILSSKKVGRENLYINIKLLKLLREKN